jgi:hypothetical protein
LRSTPIDNYHRYHHQQNCSWKGNFKTIYRGKLPRITIMVTL